MSSGAHSRELAVADGEFAFTWSDFRQIAELVHSEAGIVLTEHKANLVYSRLAKRLRAIGLRSFREYCALIEGADGADERMAMIAAMTTNVTRFFRERHHFDFLKTDAFPDLLESARAGGKVRIWSAGASSGEEPFSIALTALEILPEVVDLDFLILATDIDPEMLRRGAAGAYPARLLTEVPLDLRRRWFRPVAGSQNMDFEAVPGLRSLVRFKELNLLRDWPMTSRFDIVFCRNVMIYFDEETQNGVWARFAEVLRPGGILCIGHSERIATAIHPFDLVGQTVYRRRGART